MFKSSSRRFYSVLLVVYAMVIGLISPAMFATRVAAQTQAGLPADVPADVAKADSKKGKKKDKKSKDAADAKSTTDTKPNASANDAKRPLAVNEDPAQIGKRNINGGISKFLGGSVEKEVRLGQQLAYEAEKQMKLVDDPIVTEYINRVGQNLVLHSDAKVPFTIKVVDTDEVNAFALPGGFFYVNRGLIMAADNESELAGVMAHEIGHVAARHAVENQGKAQLFNIGMLAGIILTGGVIGSVLQNTGGLIGGVMFSKFSRQAESEADSLGVQYLYASGYDPNGMATMFEKLEAMNKKKAGKLEKLFATHPQSIDRRDASLSLISRFPEKDEYVLTTSEFQRVKARLMRSSNAKAGASIDIDDPDNGRPTLKRRQPVEDSTTSPTDSTTTDTKPADKSSAPPQLKRRGEPTPSPTPNN